MDKLYNVLPRRKMGLRLTAAGLLGVSVLAAYGYRTFFARPGEDSLRLVPETALFVASLDLSPSPQQALLFKNIDDAIDRNQLEKVEDLLAGGLASGPYSELLKGHLQRSGSFALLPGLQKGSDPRFLACISITEPVEVGQMLKKKAKPFFYKGTPYFRFPKSGANITVMDDYLVLGSDPTVFHEVRQVREGKTPPITAAADFQKSRSTVAGDANVMLVARPDLLASTEMKDTLPQGWMACSLALREGGLEFVSAGKVDPEKAGAWKRLLSMPTLRTDLYSILPGGAYGYFALASPATGARTIQDEVRKDNEHGADEVSKGIHDNFGLDLDSELIPSLEGNAVVAAYPAPGTDGGLDLMLLVDDSNGANPSDVVAKLRSKAAEQMKEDLKGKELFLEREEGGAQIFTLNPELRDEMRKSMRKGMDSPELKLDITANKTFAYAIVGKAVIAASSEEMLQRALSAYQAHQQTLSTDANFNSILPSVQSSQQSFACSVSRIAKGVRATIDESKMDGDAKSIFGQVLELCEGLQQPFSVQMGMKPDGSFRGTTTIPLDYAKAIDLIGRLTHESKPSGPITK